MSYLALYRRFRPQRFEDLIGQETVVQALVNQIKTDKIGHAYLFCGARGTGKTTAAKIFAKAINCQTASGSPCGKCDVCVKLNDPNNLDIVEMDAASNNKVENVREIREKVQYPPVAGKYKVYIIDEVHMLTTEAFNALLKTLEEPPKHAVFILATTEPHKLPATILSRCMRFDFKLVSVENIAKLIGGIFDEVGKTYDKEALTAIARAGEGSVRDALSIADICLSYNNEKLTYNDVIDVLGATDRNKTAELVSAIFRGDTGVALGVVENLCGLGKSVGMLIKDVLAFLRDIMVTKTCKAPESILALPIEEINSLKKLASETDSHGLLRTVEIFSSVENEVKYSTHPRIVFETAVVKASMPSADYNVDALMARIAKLEKIIESGNFVKTQSSASQASVVEPKKVLSEVKPVEKLISVEMKAEPAVKTVEKQAEIKPIEKQVEEPILKPTQEIKPTENEQKSAYSTVNEKVLEKTQPIIPQRPSRSARLMQDLQGFSESDIPPEQGEFGEYVSAEPTKTVNTNVNVSSEKVQEQAKVETASVEKTNEETFDGEWKSSVPERRIWGTLIKKLRESGNSMLWVICQELESNVTEGKIEISTKEEREYQSLVKPENLAKLKEVIAGICNYKVAIKKLNGEVEQVDSRDEVEQVKSVLGNVKVED